jgi:hypothetical protein
MLLTKVLILEKMIRLPFAIGRRCSSPLLRQGAFMQTMIHPEFTPGDLDGNASELCGLFMIREKDVPVESYTIVADGHEHVVAVSPGKYKSALFLLYLMTKSAAPAFRLTPEMRILVREYFGDSIIEDASRSGPKHTTVHALLGHSVYIRLALKRGYRECLANGRSLEEVIRSGWVDQAELTPTSRVPFLRLAIKTLFDGIKKKTITIAPSEDGPWPTQLWVDRVLAMHQRLTTT